MASRHHARGLHRPDTAITVNSYRKLVGKKKFVYPALKSAGPSINTYRGRWLSINISPAGRRPDYDAGCRQLTARHASFLTAGGGGLDNKPASELFMCGDTLFEVTAQTSAIFFLSLTMVPAIQSTRSAGSPARSLKTRRGRLRRGPRSRLQR